MCINEHLFRTDETKTEKINRMRSYLAQLRADHPDVGDDHYAIKTLQESICWLEYEGDAE